MLWVCIIIRMFVVMAASGVAQDLSEGSMVSTLGIGDLVRARASRPHVKSPVTGSSAVAAFANMNRVLSRGGARTLPCDAFDHTDLNRLARTLYAARSVELHDLYASRSDRRAFHFEDFGYKERLWSAEEVAAGVLSEESYNATRDGKCAEMVMWYVHHLSQAKRESLHFLEDFVLPLMPHSIASGGMAGHEYALQISCTDCHVAVQQPGKPPIRPVPPRNATGPQYPEVCPSSQGSLTPSVWYNRTKRCDWDYEPFCKPCEGIGGLVWGPGEKEWNAMPCEPLLMPAAISHDNLTSPLWPKAFTVQEYADLTFPGRDPCNVKFRNSTYTLYFDTRPEGPLYHTVGHTGPSGPSPFPGKSWALANGNFYNTVTAAGKDAFCICLSPQDPVQKNAITGPLRYDFLDTAKLIGRERIIPEYIGRSLVADHWVKGPHHFWIEVSTNLMVREWQPFNGHQIYYNWNLTRPDPALIDVPEICYKGLLHVNVSCVAPPPSLPQASSMFV
ncbi:unnamed protein product [Prorocentrum cordatum]|uniref:Uncharacterized protein n=1 Tax=Prorocentrum cordatum TaxID=2364126 RepID=A0ABN9W305_9DINO|nr:unnamed protein product [Polarella glacialis]